ncbi:MAG: glycosyltransferase family 4 protein, partial [Planctomycetaceae bacterium]|nr:glycosyltransferase family 4 protein [Planctomycetaceae bacterium]
MSGTDDSGAGRHVVVACHAWYGDVTGGAFRLASDLAAFLANRGWRVSYVCSSCSEGGPESQQISGVQIHRYPAARRGSRIGRMLHHIRQTARLVSEIHRNECAVDVVSSHSPLQGLGAALGLRSAEPFINYTVHSPFEDELLSNLSGRAGITHRAAAWLGRRIDGWNVRLANRVQTDSRWTYDRFVQRFGDREMAVKGMVAPAWVEADRFLPVDDRLQVREALGRPWQTDIPLFFTLRRLEHRMGLDMLIHASSVLARQGFRFRVLIGGGGSLYDSLQRQVDAAGLSQVVVLLGRIPEPVIPQCYAAADCFVLPTRSRECFGLIVLEAFACNSPVIGSR